MPIRDYYRILGVAPESEDVVIQAAYRALMRRYHPDTNRSADAGRRATEINEAYAVLSDPSRKARYDEELRANRANSNTNSRSNASSAGTSPPPPPPPPQQGDVGTVPGAKRSWGGFGPRIAFGLIGTLVIITAVGAMNEGSSSTLDNNIAVENLEAENLIVEDDFKSDSSQPPVATLASIPQTPVQFDDIESAADKFAQVLIKSGMSGARSTSEKCHAGVISQPTWQSADWCAAFDYAAAYVDAEVSRAGGWTSMPYFQFQAENQGDRYKEAGVPEYISVARLISIKHTAQAAVEDAVRQQIAKSAPSDRANSETSALADKNDNISYGTTSSFSTASPSFDCAKAITRSEKMVCSDPVLAALDRNMAAQYNRVLRGATDQQRSLLKRTAALFLRNRDDCSGAPCISQTYYNRMREIGDIKDGRWKR